MKVYMVCADRGIAPDGTKGASVHLRSLATSLTRLGHGVTLFCIREASTDGRFPFRLKALDGDSTLVAEAERDAPPDVIYERYSLGHLGGLETARSLGVPFVLEVNAPIVAEAELYRGHRTTLDDVHAEEFLFEQADVVTVVSEPLKAYVERIRGDAPVVVVPNGCDADLAPEPAPLNTEVVGFLGHPKPWHGADRLPRLIDQLVKRGRDARLLIIGGGPGADEVLERAVSLGIHERIEVTGSVSREEAVQRLVETSVAVAPYPHMDFFYFCPIKLIEAMAAGVPVVTSAQGDLPFLVGDGGICVPPNDSAALADAVERLLEDHETREWFGSRGRRRALAEFTWDQAARRLVEEAFRRVSRGLKR